jgi:dUTP pyrophosphatase
MDKFECELVKFGPDALIPTRVYPSDGTAGYDLFATEYVKLLPFEFRLIDTKIGINIPKGYYGRIADRSGNAANKGIHVMAGVIDAGFQGSIKVCLVNHNVKSYLIATLAAFIKKVSFDLIDPPGVFEIKPGDRIAQIIFEKCTEAEFKVVRNFSIMSERAKKEFGSTGR